ncbi:NAD(P)H-dependent oxidoreductase subunit E [Micromonospora sp. WMMA1363]|uniref:NAD(P)H-dependent oxidoreductase subunit E n=1 Tax=Micromonospora sp. WMMA1363 TaxID=3053985 RepID=UPI00259CD0A4|nr:NAD(P)H-dependent oxidoreductase subunit E [Micromonospora sp. WMMA1363]MDM4721898.1 NAD(P)H-dependent oxidoreductase subunit E [Micromonospora sp. WMMA1363]
MGEPREAFVELQERLRRPGTRMLDRLRLAQSEDGRVDADDLARAAGEFGWPVAAVTGSATYYADFAEGRRGRRHIRVCEGTSCFVSGQGQHIARIEKALGVRLGECAVDGSVSLQGVRCLGYCYDSPAILDGEQPGSGEILGGLFGDPHAAQRRTRPGWVEPLKMRAAEIPYASAVGRPVVLAGLVGDESPWEVWPGVVACGSPDQVMAEVAASGLRGRGGAGFPVGRKWSAAADEPAPRYVVANGDEGDPGSFCDRLLMESDPHRVLEGLALAGFAVGAQRGLILVRSEYPAAADQLRAAVAQAREAGHLGTRVHGSPVDFDVEIVVGAGSYVAGEETALLHALAGLRAAVQPRPPYPTSHGYLGKPTAVNNVETLAAVPWIVRHGGAAYARLGHPDEPGTKLICLNQCFRLPGVYEVEFGVPLRHLVEDLGGGPREPYQLRAVQVGGPLGGFLSPDQLDLPLLSRPLAEAGVALGHASLVAIDTTVSAAAILQHAWAFGAAESCGACTPCRVGTRRGLELAERIGEPAQTAAALAAHEPLLEVLTGASLCAFGWGVSGAVRSLLRVYADELRQAAPSGTSMAGE